MRKLFLILVLTLSASCNSIKIAEKKDNDALNRVETNIKLLSSAYARGQKLWPCVNDSVTINHTDTVITQTIKTEIRKDTVNKRDTIINTIEKTFHVRDSIRTVVKDQQGISALNDSLNNYRLRLATISGSLQESRITAQTLNNKLARKNTELYILLGLLIVTGGAFAYFRFMPKINL